MLLDIVWLRPIFIMMTRLYVARIVTKRSLPNKPGVLQGLIGSLPQVRGVEDRITSVKSTELYDRLKGVVAKLEALTNRCEQKTDLADFLIQVFRGRRRHPSRFPQHSSLGSKRTGTKST
jgi:hypothetical protein